MPPRPDPADVAALRRATILIALVLWAGAAVALPRYSLQYGQRCALCHVDPAGGGMRNAYATRALIPEELAFERLAPERTAAIRPDLSPTVAVGLDLRSLIHEGEGDRGGQLDMQGDVTVAVQMDPRFAAYVNLGKGGTQEYAGLAYVLPLDGYVKAGRFTPDYGWGWADHNQAGRRYLLDRDGARSPAALVDAGVEVGVHTQTWEATAAALQGAAANGESYAARLALRRSLGPVNLALGASVLRRQLAAGHRRAWGGFGAVAAGPLTWLFQVDETGDDQREGVLVSQELTWRLVQGIHLRGTHGHQDPDHRQATGSRTRWGVGVDSLVNPFFGVLAMANYHHLRRGELVTGNDHWQGELVLHFLY